MFVSVCVGLCRCFSIWLSVIVLKCLGSLVRVLSELMCVFSLCWCVIFMVCGLGLML